MEKNEIETIVPRLIQGNLIMSVSKDQAPILKGPNRLECDGFVTYDKNLMLSFYGADCPLIAFWDTEKIGICHAGWRGLVDGIVEKMQELFSEDAQCFISPFLHNFEITKDNCFDRIKQKYEERFFSYKGGKIMFNFKGALIETVSAKGIPYKIDDRCTSKHLYLASRRRDHLFDGPQNRLVIMKNDEEEVSYQFFTPKDDISPEKLIKVGTLKV